MPKIFSPAIIALVAMYFAWGTGFVITKIALEDFSPMVLNALRFLTAGLVLLAYCWANGKKFKGGKSERKRILISSALSIFGGNLFLNIALINLENGGIAPVITGLESSIFIIACFLAGEKFKPAIWIGLVIGFGGLCVMFWPAVDALINDSSADMTSYAIALGFLLLTAACWGVGGYFMRYHPSQSPLLLYTAWQYLVGSIVFLAIAAVTDDWALTTYSLQSWAAFIYIVIITTIVGYGSFVYILIKLPPSLVATKAYVIPIISIATGILLRGESLSQFQIIGTVVIIVGILLTSLGKSSKGKKSTD